MKKIIKNSVSSKISLIRSNFEISRKSIVELSQILHLLDKDLWELKESKNIPIDLRSHFNNYSEYEDFQKLLEEEIINKPNLSNQFSLDILPFIEFLCAYSRISSKSIPEVHLNMILGILKYQNRTITVLISALKLATTRNLDKETQSELILFLEQIDESSPFSQKTLLTYCLSEFCRRSKIQKLDINEATSILNSLNKLNLLRISTVTKTRFIRKLIDICRESINERKDWKNLALLCTVFARSRDSLLLQSCKILDQQFDQQPIFKDLVSIVWSLSQCQRKETPEFAYIIENLIIKQKLQQHILKSFILADKIVTFWSLHKIYLEVKQGQQLILDVEKILFDHICQKINQDSHITNISQFYVASLRLKLLDEKKAQIYFESVIINGDQFMISLSIYETSLIYPNLLKEKQQTIQSNLKDLVSPKNIANFFAAFKDNEDIIKELLKLAKIEQIPFSGLEIISSTINSAEFNGEITDVLLQKLKLDPTKTKEIFSGNQQQVASLLLKMDINNKDQEVQSELFLKILDFYQQEYLTDPQNLNPKGLGNILFLASKKLPQNQKQYLQKLGLHANWIQKFYYYFDMLELLKLFGVLEKFKFISSDMILKIDDRLANLLSQNIQLSGKSGRFLSSFTKHYKKSYLQLQKVNKIVDEFKEQQEKLI